MWMSSEDARSDFILAAAGVLFGTILLGFVRRAPFYPDGLLAEVLLAGWVVLLTHTVARFFVRYRGQGLDGYGLASDRSGLGDGALIALPLLVAGYVRGLSPLGPVSALFGRAGFPRVDSGPTVESSTGADVATGLLVVAAATLGAVALYGLLTTRARDGFRQTDLPLVEAVRTYGLGAVAASTVFGLLVGLASGGGVVPRLVDGIALGATVLLVDRAVAARDRTTRATVLAPAIVAFLLGIGGPFTLLGGNLAVSLWRGSTAAVVAIVVVAILETRRITWAVVPVVAVAMWSPTCTSLPVGALLTQGCV